MVPPVQPVAVGVKLTFRVALCPASKTSGRLREEVVNAEFSEVIPEIVTLVSPVFVTVTNKVWA
jgi:hypothetical protein